MSPASGHSIYYIQQFFDLPNVVGDSGFHRWGDSEGLVDSAEIVPSEIEGEHCVKFVPLFRKRIRQTGKSTHLHSHGQVLALDMRSANLAHIGIPEDGNLFATGAFGRRVAGFALGTGGIELHQLREVNALNTQAQDNSILIGLKSIGRNLEITLSGRCDLLRESYRVPLGTTAKVPSEDQFTVALNSNERPGIAKGDFIFALCSLRLFLHADVSPKLIALHVFDPQTMDTFVHQAFAPLASKREKIQNGSRVNPSDAGSRADAATLYQVLQNSDGFFFGQDHVAEWSWLYLYKRLPALWAAVSLLTLPVLSKLLSWDVTGLAVHSVSSLEQHKNIKLRKHCQEKSEAKAKKNSLGSSHPVPRMAGRRGKIMTVCIGLVCNGGKNILLAADMRATYGTTTTNDQTAKLFDLPANFCGAVAGSMGQCEDVISELYHQMNQLQAAGFAPEQVRQLIVESYHKIYIQRSDETLRGDLKISLDCYLHDKKLVRKVRQDAETILQSVVVDVDLIVAGFYSGQPVQIICEGGTSIKTRAEISPGNAVIGTGSMAALNWLNYRKQGLTLGLAHSLLHLTEAKQFAEVDSSVGPLRQVVLLWPGGFKGLEAGDQLIESWWHRYGLLLSDGLEAETHNQAMRDTFGIP